MRTTSRILGIIGSTLAVILGGASILLALLPVPSFGDGYYYYDDGYGNAALTAAPLPDGDADSSAFWDSVDVTEFSFSCAAVLGGLLGIVGCVLVNKRNKVAGALFIVASVMAISTFYPTVLFIIAAVQALKKPRPVMPPMLLVPGAYAYPVAYPYGVAAYPSPYAPAAAYPPPYPAAPAAAYPPPPYPAAPAAAYPPPYPPGAYPPYGTAWPPAPPAPPQPPTQNPATGKADGNEKGQPHTG